MGSDASTLFRQDEHAGSFLPIETDLSGMYAGFLLLNEEVRLWPDSPDSFLW